MLDMAITQGSDITTKLDQTLEAEGPVLRERLATNPSRARAEAAAQTTLLVEPMSPITRT